MGKGGDSSSKLTVSNVVSSADEEIDGLLDPVDALRQVALGRKLLVLR